MTTTVQETFTPMSAAAREAYEEKLAEATFPHAYSPDEWRPWTGNNYLKVWYDARATDGKIIEHCWPNAGYLKSGSCKFEGNRGIMCRVSATLPYER